MSDASNASAEGPAGMKQERPAKILETLNFKVTPAFKKMFKGYAVTQGMTMIELLKEGFELTKNMRNRP